MKNEKRVLRKSVRSRRKKERTKEEISIISLVEKISELSDVLPCINDPIDKTSMKYLSSLYTETIDLIKNITVYIVKEGYCGMHENIDESVIKTQEIIGLLREFQALNTSRKAQGFIDEVSKEKASSLLLSLKEKMDELLALRTIIVK